MRGEGGQGLGGRGDAVLKGPQNQLLDFPQNEKTRGGGGGDVGKEKLALNRGGGGIGQHLIESEEALSERGLGGLGGWRAGVVGSAGGEGVRKGGGVGIVREGGKGSLEEELKKSCAALVLSQGCLRERERERERER